ncbi:ATP synthase subunit gamma, mitochondrial, partial [Trichinella zimbabwensis]
LPDLFMLKYTSCFKFSMFSCNLFFSGVGPAGCLLMQRAGYATLKDISVRLKSVKNIQKITQSMKMVAAAKYSRSERDLRPARPFGEGSKELYKFLSLNEETQKKSKHLMIVLTSDRGLCGAVHSNLGKMVKQDMQQKPDNVDVKIVCVGDKSKAILTRVFPENILMTVNDIGKKPPTFEDARQIVQEILNSGYTFDQGDIYYNRFKFVCEIDESTFESFFEYNLTSLLFCALKENACSEQSSRMSAMDSASKNASEMIRVLSLQYNRTRQAVITRELIDIVVGASAL